MALAGCSSGSRCFPRYLVVDRDRFTEVRPDAGTRKDGARLGSRGFVEEIPRLWADRLLEGG